MWGNWEARGGGKAGAGSTREGVQSLPSGTKGAAGGRIFYPGEEDRTAVLRHGVLRHADTMAGALPVLCCAPRRARALRSTSAVLTTVRAARV